MYGALETVRRGAPLVIMNLVLGLDPDELAPINQSEREMGSKD